VHAQTAEEDDEHGCPHVILHEGVEEGVHLTSVLENCVEKRAKDGEDKSDRDKNTKRIHVVLIHRLGEPSFDKVVD
jgi:hypothetical protein